ncbi:MAG: hypothetical protein S4CHLAM45_06150 [Chlamydiales bacterium]|nr:hypothetical protein [Chlamydiales bacterium]MCH9619845.1 hypothetical protein [Chlamydiales bacterium]MCH9622728.1 hypothetical protein [Chlamydiales bacterium]
MAIIIQLDLLLAKKKKRSKDLAKEIGISEKNLSILKTEKEKALRFSTLKKSVERLSVNQGNY